MFIVLYLCTTDTRLQVPPSNYTRELPSVFLAPRGGFPTSPRTLSLGLSLSPPLWLLAGKPWRINGRAPEAALPVHWPSTHCLPVSLTRPSLQPRSCESELSSSPQPSNPKGPAASTGGRQTWLPSRPRGANRRDTASHVLIAINLVITPLLRGDRSGTRRRSLVPNSRFPIPSSAAGERDPIPPDNANNLPTCPVTRPMLQCSSSGGAHRVDIAECKPHSTTDSCSPTAEAY